MDDPQWRAKLVESPKNAPKNTVLIYDGGSRAGHAEVKVTESGRGGYASDYFSMEPPGKDYHLIGVYYKPPVQMVSSQ